MRQHTRASVIALALTAFSCSLRAGEADAIFDTAHIHDVYVMMDPADWQELRENYLEDTKYQASFTWNEFHFEKVELRSRGSTSRNALKPSLKIDFDGVEEDQRFGALKSLVLDNNTQDNSLLKERLSLKLFAEMGLHAPRASLGRLMVNGVFAGVYTITEPVDEAFLIRTRGESNGFLYEYNSIEPYYFEFLGDDPAQYIPERFEPKTHEDDPGPEPLIRFIESLNMLPSGELAQYLRSVTDIEKLISYIAAEQYLAEVDGVNGWAGVNNFYLYQTADGPVFEFIPWDKDLTFQSAEGSILYNFDQTVITRRIWEDAGLRRLYLEAIRRIAVTYGGSGGWLHREFEGAVQQVRSNAHADPFLLGCSFGGGTSECTGDGSLFESEIARMRDFIERRNEHVLNELESLEANTTP
jgi:spore coat protein CotH